MFPPEHHRGPIDLEIETDIWRFQTLHALDEQGTNGGWVGCFCVDRATDSGYQGGTYICRCTVGTGGRSVSLDPMKPSGVSSSSMANG